jgi:cbb3-type cytochrome oxidase subunit 3
MLRVYEFSKNILLFIFFFLFIYFTLRTSNETNGKNANYNETSKDNSLKNDAGHGLFSRDFLHV